MLGNIVPWHLIILLFSVIPFALWIIALVQISNSGATTPMIVTWVIVVTLLPVLGAISWFIGGRRSVARRPPAPPSS
ncbi:MAG: PLDc N-terminal domain-containing protein [Lacisediminihabitans sp.]